MTKIEQIPEGAAAIAIAALHVVQRLTVALVQSGVMTKEQAVAMYRSAADLQTTQMDETWAPDNEKAAHILEAIAKDLEQTPWGK